MNMRVLNVEIFQQYEFPIRHQHKMGWGYSYNLIYNWTNMRVQRTRPKQLHDPLTAVLGHPKSMQCNFNSCSFNYKSDYIKQFFFYSASTKVKTTILLTMWSIATAVIALCVTRAVLWFSMKLAQSSSHTSLAVAYILPMHSFVAWSWGYFTFFKSTST